MFPIKPNSEEFAVGCMEVFFGIVADYKRDSLDVLRRRQDMRDGADEKGWPENLIPISYDSGSGTITLSFKGEDKGSVYYFVEFRYFLLVAETFDEFLDLLYPSHR